MSNDIFLTVLYLAPLGLTFYALCELGDHVRVMAGHINALTVQVLELQLDKQHREYLETLKPEGASEGSGAEVGL